MDTDWKRPIKFGVPDVERERGTAPYAHGNVFEVLEMAGGVQGLMIGPARGHVELMLALMKEMDGPFGVLYVLVVSRVGNAEGRYQSPVLEKVQVRELLEEFRD